MPSTAWRSSRVEAGFWPAAFVETRRPCMEILRLPVYSGRGCRSHVRTIKDGSCSSHTSVSNSQHRTRTRRVYYSSRPHSLKNNLEMHPWLRWVVVVVVVVSVNVTLWRVGGGGRAARHGAHGASTSEGNETYACERLVEDFVQDQRMRDDEPKPVRPRRTLCLIGKHRRVTDTPRASRVCASPAVCALHVTRRDRMEAERR